MSVHEANKLLSQQPYLAEALLRIGFGILPNEEGLVVVTSDQLLPGVGGEGNTSFLPSELQNLTPEEIVVALSLGLLGNEKNPAFAVSKKKGEDRYTIEPLRPVNCLGVEAFLGGLNLDQDLGAFPVTGTPLLDVPLSSEQLGVLRGSKYQQRAEGNPDIPGATLHDVLLDYATLCGPDTAFEVLLGDTKEAGDLGTPSGPVQVFVRPK